MDVGGTSGGKRGSGAVALRAGRASEDCGEVTRGRKGERGDGRGGREGHATRLCQPDLNEINDAKTRAVTCSDDDSNATILIH